MFRRIQSTCRTIRNFFRRKKKIRPLILDNNEPVNYNVPTPVHLFQVPQLRFPEVQSEEEEAEKQAEVKEMMVQPVELLNTIAKDAGEDSEHIEDLEDMSSTCESEDDNSPDAEGAESSETTKDISECPSNAVIGVVVKRTAGITDKINNPTDIEPSPGAMLIMVQEAKKPSDEPKPVLSAEHAPSPGSESSSSLVIEDLEESHSLENVSEFLPLEIDLPQAPHNFSARPSEIEERSDSECPVNLSPDSIDFPTPAIPSILIEDFQFCQWIGSGSFGQVFKAKHKKSGKMVAIKKIEKTKTTNIQSLFLERDILKLVRNARNPFLVSFFCSFQREHHVYIAMEFAAGGTLESRLKNGALPPNNTLFYSACIVLGIKFLHENRIVHRDLKPANIVLDSDGYAKIADFGLCKAGIGYRDEMMYPCGTKHYWAPEMFAEINYDRTVDWWALGIIIYEMAVGKMPFTGKNMNELRENVFFKKPEFPGNLDNKTCMVIKLLLDNDCRCRLGSFRDDGEEVKNFCYFDSISWNALMAKQVRAPFIPSPDDATEEDSEGGIVTPQSCMSPISPTAQEAFRGFDEFPENS